MPLSQEMIEKQDIVDRLLALPVRTLITNVDTGATGPQSVEVPLEMRDALAADIARLRAEVDKYQDAVVDASQLGVEGCNALRAEVTTLKAKLAEAVERVRNNSHALAYWQREAIHAGARPSWSEDCILRGKHEMQANAVYLQALQSKAASPTEDAQ